MKAFDEYFSRNKNFVFENGIYRQVGLDREEFEQEYINARTKEGRMYEDDIVRKLPNIPRDHALYNEWKLRTNPARNFAAYLKVNNCRSIVEVGCGNGWLTNFIQNTLGIPACGIDIEKRELYQAARISKGKSTFVYADIFSDALTGLKADAVLLAACVQYFPDVKQLITRLRDIGTIYIIDSPVYKNGKADGAKARSAAYFGSMGAPGMEKFYYHHERKEFDEFKPEYLYDPEAPLWWVLRRIFKSSPFPWIKIKPLNT